MQLGFLPTCLIAALIPLLVGFVWYNPKVLGNAWIQASGLKEEEMKNANMLVIFGLTYVFSFFLATSLVFMTIHQAHIASIFQGNADFGKKGTELNKWYHEFMQMYGNNFRTFKHGAFHGLLSGFFVGLPLIGVNALFERKGFKYIAINVGFWIICMSLMGGFICQFLKWG